MIDLRVVAILGGLTLGCRDPSEAVSTESLPNEDPPAATPENATEDPEPPRVSERLALSMNGTGAGCWIRDDGRVVCWGRDQDGSLGGAIAKVPFAEARVIPEIRDAVQIDGDDRRCVVTKAGEVHCFGPLHMLVDRHAGREVWGHSPPMRSRAMWFPPWCHTWYSFHGGWQDPECTGTSYFVDPQGRLAWYAEEREYPPRNQWELVDGIADIVELSVAHDHACVRTEAGAIHCLDDASPPGHVARIEGIESPLQLSAGWDSTLIRADSGVVHRVRLDQETWRVEPTGVEDAVELVESCALRAAGKVTCDLAGERWDLAAPPARAFVRSAGFACIIAEADSKVHCAGRPGARLRHVESLSPARAVVSWEGRPCVLHESGDIRCTNAEFAKPELPGIRAEAIASNEEALCALSDGRVLCWPIDWEADFIRLPIDDAVEFERFAEHMCVRRTDRSLLCLDRTGEEYAELRSGPIAGLGTVVEVAVGGEFACAREQGGSVRCWGDGESGSRGAAEAGSSLSPAKVEGIDDAVDIDASRHSVCVVRSSGRVMCWEFSRYRSFELVPGFENVAQISLQPDQSDADGFRHNGLCARHLDGTVSCAWPADPRYPELAEPTRIPNVESAIHVQAAMEGACAVTEEHEVVCWTHRYESFGLYELGVPLRPLAMPGIRGLDFGGLHQGCFDVPGVEGPRCWGIARGRSIIGSSFTLPAENPRADDQPQRASSTK